MSSPYVDDPLAHLTQFDQRSTRTMIVKIAAVDLANGLCSVNANDDGGNVGQVPFYGYDPAVGDICLAFVFEGTIAVMGNAPLRTKITTVADPVTAASGWAITNSYMDYGREAGEVYLNVTRTGAAIAGSVGGDITNSVVAQIKGGLPLPATQVGLSSIGGNRQIGGVVSSAGVITLTFLGPSLTFNTGFTFNASANFVRGS